MDKKFWPKTRLDRVDLPGLAVGGLLVDVGHGGGAALGEIGGHGGGATHNRVRGQ